jgi:hypothetical protein
MSDPIDTKLARNLERWRRSGQPEHWCAANQGHHSPDDWEALLGSLWWSEYWPMEPAAIRGVLDELCRPLNLRRWRESGQPWRWIDSQHGVWSHDDWQALLRALEHSEFWPMDPAAIGALLEELRFLWLNLERWKQSGMPRQWVEARQGAWNHADWLALVQMLQHSEYWPMDLTMVGQTLEALKRSYHALLRWQLSGHPQRWVAARQGQWDDSAWQSLVAALRQSEYWPLDPIAVARVLEGHQREWWNLQRWRDAGLARRWVEAHAGQWSHDDWLRLLASLRAAGYWPIEPAALGQVLEQARTEWLNLQRWQASGEPEAWIAAHAGSWGNEELQTLVDTLWQSEYWPLDVRAVQNVLEELDRGQHRLRGWEETEHAAAWMAAHRDGWDHVDWLGLLEELRGSDYWPLPLENLAAMLHERRRRDEPAIMRMPPPIERWAA